MPVYTGWAFCGYGYIHGYPRKICGYGYGYGCDIPYPRQPWTHRISSLINQRLVALSLSLTINTSVDKSSHMVSHMVTCYDFYILSSG